ncbi:MAG: metallophosphoesterase [Acidobacteria bacterium]|nr:metallophosphoesterase [Acidobacteriota bacterium]
MKRALVLLLLAASLAPAQEFFTYIGTLSSDQVLIAWGKTSGVGNTIGRDSKPYGNATVTVGDQVVNASQNWALVTGLKPDTEYHYEVKLGSTTVGSGSFRTWAAKATRLVFFVIGDFGNGSTAQYQVADAMTKEFERRRGSGNPVRFVITTGDNIYSDINVLFSVRNSGDEDRDWERKFFRPYQKLLASIPFYPSPGNHDGNGSEARGDLFVYLDNFFFPENKPARWYHFSYGDLADFFSLDSTDNTENGPPRPVYGPTGAEFKWMSTAMPASKALWKIPYFHHPPFNAGPRHMPYLRQLDPWLGLFERCGVKVAFNGHEHNFQYSEVGALSRGIEFVISGAGGELRSGNVAKAMRASYIAGWSSQHHFLVVEIEGKNMQITPLSFSEMVVHTRDNSVAPMPLRVNLP